MKYVIVGNSAAAIGAVEGIRQVDLENEITIITNEAYHTYSRPLISYMLLGKVKEEGMGYRAQDFYTKNNCKVMYSQTVACINNDTKNVVLESGEEVAYDKLLVATGSSPFVPTFEGLEKVKNQFTFLTLDDAKALQKEIREDAKVLIVGAGLIGLKCCEGILDKVGEVTVVDLAPRVLSSILDDESAKIIQDHIESKGVTFKLAQTVERFEANEALLNNGEAIPFDIVVLAVGVRPNTALVKDANGTVNRGIVINEKMQTSIQDVYAAGDCTESFDISSDSQKILALLPNAYMQGECAGVNMAGGDKVFDRAIPMNAIGFFGLHMLTAGSYEGEVYSSDINGFKRIYYKDDLLKGFILIGDNIEKAGIYTKLIREKTPLSTIDFELICQKPGLMAFGQEIRNKVLGGV